MKKILFISAELFPFVKTGGLADYSEAICKMLSKDRSIDLRILIPGYPIIIKNLKKAKPVLECKTILTPQHKITLLEGLLKHFTAPVYVLKAPQLYEREGNPYVDSTGNDWPDNFERFATLSMVPYLMITHNAPWVPDIIHLNDWHTGLAPAYLRLLPKESRPKSLFTIHNIAFQGNFSDRMFLRTGLPLSMQEVDGLEFFGKCSFMKSGVNFSDKVVTVSPSYALEICFKEDFSFGFSGILAAKGEDFTGILNGADYTTWSPYKDKNLRYNYNKTSLSTKEKQKQHFQDFAGLAIDKKAFLIASVSRLSHQKGLDIAVKVLQKLVPEYPNLQFICAATGDKAQETEIEELAKKYPEQIWFFNGYDETLAHKAIGSADAFLMPSRFEPCGLTQIYSLKYGTIPLVTPVGGLLDTVEPYKKGKIEKVTGTGFISENVSEEAIESLILEAMGVFLENPSHWQKLMLNAMGCNFGWAKSAKQYKLIYDKLAEPLEV